LGWKLFAYFQLFFSLSSRRKLKGKMLCFRDIKKNRVFLLKIFHPTQGNVYMSTHTQQQQQATKILLKLFSFFKHHRSEKKREKIFFQVENDDGGGEGLDNEIFPLSHSLTHFDLEK
jgi:virulence-associated protein VapD